MFAVMAVESAMLGVPPSDFIELPIWILAATLKTLTFLGLVYVGGMGLFAWRYGLPLIFRDVRKFFSAWDGEVIRYLEGPVFARGIVGVLIAILAMAAFVIQKCYIPFLSPYHWDPALAALDHALHFGKYPHEWLLPVVTATKSTAFLDKVYALWFLFFYFLVGFAMFCEKDARHHIRFMWSYAFVLPVIGNYFATFFSSVGPVFFGAFYPDIQNPYQDMVAYLDDVNQTTPLLTFSNLSMLVEWVRNDQFIDYNSISAMPSVHIAVMWILVLYCWKYHWFFRATALVLCALVFIASVFLGFHYAVDGYFSIVLTSLFWWVSGILAKRGCPEIPVSGR